METIYRYNGKKPRLRPAVNMRSLPPDGGGRDGGWSCKKDGGAIFLLGLIFTSLAIMTAGAEPILVGAAWAGIGYYGGLATTGWGIGHVLGCGF